MRPEPPVAIAGACLFAECLSVEYISADAGVCISGIRNQYLRHVQRSF